MPKVLIAEDDLEIQKLIRFTLESNGYEVISAEDGVSALDKIYKERPDVIVLDIIMPGMKGYEVCEKIKENADTCLIPVIMLTSLSQTKDRITGIKLGADEYLVKPFEPYELLTRIERIYERSKQWQSLNPLTGLPGIVQLDEKLKSKMASNQEFTVMLLDFNDFKSYNNKYGYEKGDNVLKVFGGILKSIKGRYGRNDFIAHISSDDFVILLENNNAEELAIDIIQTFESYFSQDILTIAIGIKKFSPQKIKHYSEIIPKLQELQTLIKKQKKNSYVLD